MQRRMIGLFSCLVLMMSICIYRIYAIDSSDYLTMAAQVQGRYNLGIASARGGIYDRNMELLVNTGHRYVASVLPTPQATTELLRVMPEERHPALLEQLQGGLPFALEVPTNNIYAVGIDVFRVPTRYGEEQLSPHIIGYLGDEGKVGVAGIERAYDQTLIENGAQFTARFHLDAAGRTMEGAGVEIERVNEDSSGGVVLTLDESIQRITQAALKSGCDKGAAVVLDIHSGDILAMASLPAYDQNNIAASLESLDAPFINRAISGYNIGSVFKLAIASAALENGFTKNRAYECEGYVDVGGQIFRCNNHAIHGVIDMQKALQVSCNTYFITLAQQLDENYLLSLCRNYGISVETELAPGITTQKGNLPTLQELSNPAALANFSFGQGSSLATPLQISQMIATIANGGTAVTPRLVMGLTEDGQMISAHTPLYAGNAILADNTSQVMQQLMIGVIEGGSGRTATPLSGGAGGKTSSAQTGIVDEETGKETVHAWFAGFYPAETPKYSVVVFVEGGESGETIAAPIFKHIVDGIGGKE